MHKFVFRSYLDNGGHSPRMVLFDPQRVGSFGAGENPVGQSAAANPKTSAMKANIHRNFIYKIESKISNSKKYG